MWAEGVLAPEPVDKFSLLLDASGCSENGEHQRQQASGDVQHEVLPFRFAVHAFTRRRARAQLSAAQDRPTAFDPGV